MDTTENLKKIETRDWIIIALIILVILLTFGTAFFYHKYHNAEKQVVIWNDSTYYYKNKYGEEYAAKNTYILEAEQLKKYNEELYKEYKSLKDNPIVITKTKIVTKIDSVPTVPYDIQFEDSTIKWNWIAQDNDYYKINGHSGVDLTDINSPSTMIDSMKFDTKLTLDVVDNGEQLAVIAKTDNPYTSLTGMESVIIDPTTSPTLSKYYKPKRWGFSVYLGAGVNVGYDPINKGIGLNIGPSAGFAITYDIVQW